MCVFVCWFASCWFVCLLGFFVCVSFGLVWVLFCWLVLCLAFWVGWFVLVLISLFFIMHIWEKGLQELPGSKH